METAPSWLQNAMQGGSADSSSLDSIVQLSKPPLAVAWLRHQLRNLPQHPTSAAAAAAGVPPGLLQEMRELAEELGPKFDPIDHLCRAAGCNASSPIVDNPAAEAAVFKAVLQGCAEGWLTKGLQQLGAKVWAAWPQKYACNDDRCLNLSGLTEQSCARQRCTGCKVRGSYSLTAGHKHLVLTSAKSTQDDSSSWAGGTPQHLKAQGKAADFTYKRRGMGTDGQISENT
jgi:hypothetical protein